MCFDLHFWDVGPIWPFFGAVLTKWGPFWLGAVLTVIPFVALELVPVEVQVGEELIFSPF